MLSERAPVAKCHCVFGCGTAGLPLQVSRCIVTGRGDVACKAGVRASSRRAAKQSSKGGGAQCVTLSTQCVFSNSSLICGRKGCGTPPCAQQQAAAVAAVAVTIRGSGLSIIAHRLSRNTCVLLARHSPKGQARPGQPAGQPPPPKVCVRAQIHSQSSVRISHAPREVTRHLSLSNTW